MSARWRSKEGSRRTCYGFEWRKWLDTVKQSKRKHFWAGGARGWGRFRFTQLGIVKWRGHVSLMSPFTPITTGWIMSNRYSSSLLEKIKMASFSFPEVKGWITIVLTCKASGTNRHHSIWETKICPSSWDHNPWVLIKHPPPFHIIEFPSELIVFTSFISVNEVNGKGKEERISSKWSWLQSKRRQSFQILESAVRGL